MDERNDLLSVIYITICEQENIPQLVMEFFILLLKSENIFECTMNIGAPKERVFVTLKFLSNHLKDLVVIAHE